MSMLSRRSFPFALGALAFAALVAASPAQAAHAVAGLQAGHVFTSSNAAAGNELLVYAPAADGSLALQGHVPTQGLGTGAGLGSQGAVALSGDGRYVFVVNAGSNTVSTFTLDGDQAVLASVVDSGGLGPISVAESDGVVYVLNAQGSGNVAGFRNVDGQLQPLPDGVRPLSAAGGTAPAQVGFGRDVLIVTEKGTNDIVSYRVRRDGTASQPRVTPSAGQTPFGFAFDRRDHLVVSEAFGGTTGASAASSYRFSELAPASPMLVSASVPTQQTAACWVAITPNGRYAYTANAGDSSISSYRIGHDGRLTLLAPAAGITATGAGVLDLAIPAGGRQLFALAPKGGLIASYSVRYDGALLRDGQASGLPASAAGLAAN